MDFFEICEMCGNKTNDFHIIDNEGPTLYCNNCWKQHNELNENLEELSKKYNLSMASIIKEVNRENKRKT